jgi:CheY-like chemotaxis protein
MRVLVAEDNAALGAVLRLNFQLAGAQVTLASSGTEAIDALKREAFDVLVTDYQMPGATGEEVIRAARSSAPNRDVAVILLTAKELELDIGRLRQELAIGLSMAKPFSPRRVVQAAQELAAARRREAASGVSS